MPVKNERSNQMARADLHNDMIEAAADVVLKRVEGCIKNLRPDMSATAQEHVVGFEAGFRQAKRAMLDLLADSL